MDTSAHLPLQVLAQHPEIACSTFPRAITKAKSYAHGFPKRVRNPVRSSDFMMLTS
jgi:hypothetical protein